MAKFLTQPELYLLFQRELPRDVYPFSANPADFWSTSSIAAKAQTVAKAYEALETRYDNFWPQTADGDGLAQFEISYFGSLSQGLSDEDRADRILSKMRSRPSLSNPDLTAIVEAELPPGTLVILVGLNSFNEGEIDGGTWYLDESELGVDTFLGAYGSHAYPIGTDLCQEDGSSVGMSPTEWAEYQQQAYTYEVRIYDYTPSAAELASIESALNVAEPARSQHTIVLTRTYMDPLPALASTTLRLVADDWDGVGNWIDSSGHGNNAIKVGAPTIVATPFLDRLAIQAGAASRGFHAPGDDFNASTQRTYEVVLGSYGTGSSQYIIGRDDGFFTQFATWLYKTLNNIMESSVNDNTAAHPWMGSTSYSNPVVDSLPVVLHAVADGPTRTIKLYQNGVLLVQNNNPLFGTLGTPTGLHLGIFSTWNTIGLNPSYFNGTIMEVQRHEELLSQATIQARIATFNRIKGY